jgi:hypothetical protein
MFYPFELDKDSRRELTQALGSLMSQISENAVSARWPRGLEEKLPPELVIGVGQYHFLDVQARTILALASVLGHWAKLDRLEGQRLVYEPYYPESVVWDDDANEWALAEE